jgi:hypothetical protein
MQIKTTTVGENKIIEIISKEIIIKNEQAIIALIANADSQYIILHDYNFEKDFFDLSTKKLGEVLQKFTTYFVNLAIIGDFNKYPSETLKDFIYESNKRGNYLFMSSVDEVIKRWKSK